MGLAKKWLNVSWMVCLTAMTAYADPHVPHPTHWADRVPLFSNLGTLHHPMMTSAPLAQKYFDQGLRLVFAFNHEEAINSFREAARHAPQAAMPHWVIALALGPNINLPMDKAQEKQAVEAIRAALKLVGQVSPTERSYIEALAQLDVASPGR